MNWLFLRPRRFVSSPEQRYLLLGVLTSASLVFALQRSTYERYFDLFWRSLIEQDLYYHGSPQSPKALFTEELAVLKLVEPKHTWTR